METEFDYGSLDYGSDYGIPGLVESSGASSTMGMFFGGFFVVYLAIIALMIASLWKIFVKAGKPGWAAIIPIYNIIVMLQVAGMPTWYFILLLIPFVNIAIAIMLVIKIAKVFGKPGEYAIGLILLPIIFYPMLAFGKSQYVGDGAINTTTPPQITPEFPSQTSV